MNLSLCVKNYLLSNHVSFNFDNSPSRWVLFSSFHKWGNWDSKFKLAETSCLQLIEWDLNPGLPNSDVRMVSGNVSTKEGLSPLAFKTSNSQKVSQPFPASLEQGLAGCYNLSICCVWLTAQLCPTLCDPMDGSPPGSSVHWILQARLLEWVAIPSSRGSSQPRDQTQFSRIAGVDSFDWATREAQCAIPANLFHCLCIIH